MVRKFRLLPVVSALIVAAGSRSQGQTALLTQRIDEAKLVTLAGNVRREANRANDRGRVADSLPMEHMLLQLQRSPEQEQALETFIDQLHDPSSPNFQKWITADEFGQRFGLAQQDLDAITVWLESHGFEVHVYPNRMLIDFSGTAGQVREAFHTEIHQLAISGKPHIANTSDPQIPAALARAVQGIVSLHDFMPRPLYKIRPNYTVSGFFGDTYELAPGDLATIYNINPVFKAGYSGKGQTIVVIEDTNVYSSSDWTVFRQTFGLSSYTSGSFVTVHPAPKSGTNNCSNPGVVAGNDAEAILDAEWASAAAPNAKIEMASCADTATTFGGLIALQNLINETSTPPAIVSISYGACEAENGAASNAAYNSAYQQAVSEGVSVFVASGDSAASLCDAGNSEAAHGVTVSAFASTPYNVAVGGTDFSDTYSGTNTTYWNSTNNSTYSSALSYIPEIPWNDSCASTLISEYLTGSGVTYGSNGFCNSFIGSFLYLTTVGGSGGPSKCATGVPSISGVASGTCKGYPKPSWQSGVIGIPKDGVRDLPDVSLFAADGVWSHYYVFCWSDTANGGSPCTGAPSGWSGAGGTSFASPIMAGIQALVNQKNGARQGNPDVTYYKLAAKEYGTSGSSSCNSTKGKGIASTCIFNDVTQGDMDVPCSGTYNCYGSSSSVVGVLSTSDTAYQPAYRATTGWDFATGIGTVNAYNLVTNWASVNASAASPR
jgi:subtilase family serine protease